MKMKILMMVLKAKQHLKTRLVLGAVAVAVGSLAGFSLTPDQYALLIDAGVRLIEG